MAVGEISVSITEDITTIDLTQSVTTVNITPSVTEVDVKGISIASASASGIAYGGQSNTLGTGSNVDLALDHINTNGFNKTAGDTVSGTATFTGLVDFNNTVSFNSNIDTNLALDDDKKILLGAGSDLQIFHQTSNDNSIIREVGGGSLSLQTNGSEITLWDYTNLQHMAQFVVGGEVNLRYNGSSKLRTTDTGVDITGEVTATEKMEAPLFKGDLEGAVPVSYTHLTLPTKRIV